MPAIALDNTEMRELVPYLRSLAPIVRDNPLSTTTRKFQTTTGQTLEGRVMGEGMSDLQLRTADNHLRLLRKSGSAYKVVTSQTDWPTYNGDPSGNRYSKLTQITKANVSHLTPAWIFPMSNAPQVENTPVVIEGVMYVSNANECYALDAGSGRAIWHFQRPRTKGVAGNAATGFN